MNRTDIRSTLDEESIRLTKSLGQNLLHDQNVLRRIVAAAELAPGDQVLEVGPGLGALTGHLLPAVDRLTAIEADRRLAERLREKYKAEPKLQLHHADALQFLVKLAHAHFVDLAPSSFPVSQAQRCGGTSPHTHRLVDYMGYYRKTHPAHICPRCCFAFDFEVGLC